MKTNNLHLFLAVATSGLAVFSGSVLPATISAASLWLYVYFSHVETHLNSWQIWLETFNSHAPEANDMIGEYFKR
jgi:hypothetical protein